MRRSAALLLIVLMVAVLVGPLLLPFDGIRQDRSAPFAAPGRVHWLGTDAFGRDEFARLLLGARLSILEGLFATALALACGLAIGAVAGFYAAERRWLDEILMRTAELIPSIPWIFLVLAIRALLPLTLSPSAALTAIAVIAGFTGWPRLARLIRGITLSERERDYVTAACQWGASDFYLFRRHVLPALSSVLATQAALLVPQFLLAEVTLSFLGLGVGEPAPSLGNMLATLRNLAALTSYPWMLSPALLLILFSGLCQALARRPRQAYDKLH